MYIELTTPRLTLRPYGLAELADVHEYAGDKEDIKYMLYLLELARDLARPVLIHLTTRKGKGYKFSDSGFRSFGRKLR